MKILFFVLAGLFLVGNSFAFDIKSEVFESKGYIPDRYTCDAQDFSPPLHWDSIPSNAKSLVLICDDSDAPYNIWTHWLLFNIPVNISGIKEAISGTELESLGVIKGINDFGKECYRGPCPKQGGVHRYSFKLYAIGEILSLSQGANKKEVVEAMQGHIIAEAKIIGLYRKKAECESCKKNKK